MNETIIDNYLGQLKMKLSPKYFIENEILCKGYWEAHVLCYVNTFVQPGQVCLDIGANAGFHTLAMAQRVGSMGRVLAFEPNSVTFPRLVDNVNLNPDLRGRILVEKIGLSDKDETLKLFQAGETGNAYVASEFKEELWNRGKPGDFDLVLVTRLDDYIQDSPVHFIKLDVEGMEINVLRGAEQLIIAQKPVILYETLLDSFDPAGIKACEDFLRDLGYDLFGLGIRDEKLHRVTFPNYPADTLALHADFLPQVEGLIAV